MRFLASIVAFVAVQVASVNMFEGLIFLLSLNTSRLGWRCSKTRNGQRRGHFGLRYS